MDGHTQSGASQGDAATTIDGVLLYDERYLACARNPDGMPPAPGAPALLAALHAAPDAAARERAVREALRSIDVEWLEFGKLVRQGERLQPVSFLRTYGPPSWSHAYCAHRFWQHDTRVENAARLAGAPHAWSVAQPHPEGARRMFEMLALRGVGSGLSICLPAAAPQQAIAMHFLSRRADLDWAGTATMAAALLIGVCVQEFVARHALPVVVKDLAEGMSALQARIADCVLRGYSDQEVARTLDLSQYTVDYHLRALRTRFKVRNRVQLAQAIRGAQRPYAGAAAVG